MFSGQRGEGGRVPFAICSSMASLILERIRALHPSSSCLFFGAVEPFGRPFFLLGFSASDGFSDGPGNSSLVGFLHPFGRPRFFVGSKLSVQVTSARTLLEESE